MKKLVGIIKIFIVSLLPTLLQYISNSNLLEILQKAQIIGMAVDVPKVKTVIGLFGCVLTAFMLVYYQWSAEKKIANLEKINNQLLELHKKSFVKLLSSKVSNTFEKINIRIFVPHYSLKYYLSCKRHLEFVIKNFSELADTGITNNLRFQVLPTASAEGLVGDCYNSKRMVYDDNLEETNEQNYHLSEYQKNKTRTLKFSMVCPLFKNKQEVVAVVAFDSEEKVVMPSKNSEEYRQLTQLVLTYSQTLYETVPELFKEERGVT